MGNNRYVCERPINARASITIHILKSNMNIFIYFHFHALFTYKIQIATVVHDVYYTFIFCRIVIINCHFYTSISRCLSMYSARTLPYFIVLFSIRFSIDFDVVITLAVCMCVSIVAFISAAVRAERQVCC